MAGSRLSIRIDLPSGARIGPGKIALLHAIVESGSISAAARMLDMSYRRAWLLVEEINEALREPAVIAAIGGRSGGGAIVTDTGQAILALYAQIEANAQSSSDEEFRALGKLVRHKKA